MPYFKWFVRKPARDFAAGDWGKKIEAGSICNDRYHRSAFQSRSLEQLMDQDSINIDNGENQVDKRARVLEQYL